MNPRSFLNDTAAAGVPVSGRTRLWAVLGLAAVCVVVIAGAWFWWQAMHPGMVHYRQGMDYAAGHQWEQAEREWQQGVKEDPSFSGCYEKLGDLYREGRNYPAAEEKYAVAAKLSPRDGSLFFRLALVQQKRNEIRAAAASVRRAVELHPDDAEANRLYGELAIQSGDQAGALAALRRAHTLRPADPDILHRLVQLDLDLQDRTGAERDLAPWTQTHPDDARASYWMSLLYQGKPHTPENVQSGIAYAQRAIAGMPGDPQAYIVLGQFYLEAKRPEEALKTYLAIAISQPNNEAILQGLVDCYNRLHRPDQAEKAATRLQIATARHRRIDQLKRALNANPSNVEAGLELPRLEEEEGDREAAHSDYTRILRQAPNDPRIHKALAAFYRRTGRPDLAERAEDIDYSEGER